MDEIAVRLKDTTEECQAAFDAWSGNRKGSGETATLKEAVHNLRKVASRLEIEMAKNEREELAQRPIPIPPHRASKGYRGDKKAQTQQAESVAADAGAGQPPVAGSGGVEVKTVKRRVVRRKKPDES